MSSVNYNLNNKGVRLIDAKDAWIKTAVFLSII